MKALILKDIATVKKTLLLTLVISFVISIYGVYEKAIFMIPLICITLPLILVTIAYGYDVKSNFEQFVFTMPISKNSYVFSKLFFSFAFGILGSIAIFILLFLEGKFQFENIILISILTLVASLLVSSIQLPFVLKYGAEKGRLILVITYFLIFALSTLLKENTDFIMYLYKMSSKFSPSLLGIGLILLGVFIIGICIRASLFVMKDKEF